MLEKPSPHVGHSINMLVMTTSKENKTLGSRLSWLRDARKLTQADVAVAIGISRTFLGGIERDLDAPGRETLMALADYYDVSVEWLVTGKGPMKPGAPAAQTDEEMELLRSFRAMDPDEARVFLIQAKRAAGS